MFSKFILNKVCNDIMDSNLLSGPMSDFMVRFIKSNMNNLIITTGVNDNSSKETVSLRVSRHSSFMDLFYENDVLYDVSYDLVKMMNFNSKAYYTLSNLVLKANESLDLNFPKTTSINVKFNDLDSDGVFYSNSTELSIFMFDTIDVVVKNFLDYYCEKLYSKFVIAYGEKALNNDNFFEILTQELGYDYSELFRIKVTV